MGADMLPQLPDLGSHAYLWELWTGRDGLGRLERGEMGGVRPVSHAEVQAFADREGLDRQEARALRAMSCAYVDGLNLGNDIFAIPPWDGD